MNSTAKIFTVAAASFAIWGDYYLKKYGDARRVWDLVLCLGLWEVCALMWVLCYRQRVPLGQSTVYGQAIVVTMNLFLGWVLFAESLKPLQWLGAFLVLVGIVLVG